MQIQLNGEQKDIESGTTVGALLEGLGLAPGTVVVELDGRIVGSQEFPAVTIRDGSRVEILRFVGGG